MPSILFCPTIRLNDDGDTAQPSIRIEFNYVRSRSHLGTEDPRIDFVSAEVVDSDYLDEYLSAPAWKYGLVGREEKVMIFECLAQRWLEDDGYEKAVAAVQEGWT
jgi:hypothetical protein